MKFAKGKRIQLKILRGGKDIKLKVCRIYPPDPILYLPALPGIIVLGSLCLEVAPVLPAALVRAQLLGVVLLVGQVAVLAEVVVGVTVLATLFVPAKVKVLVFVLKVNITKEIVK